MNLGSGILPMTTQTSVSGNAMQSSRDSGGIFGSVLAAMTKSVETTRDADSNVQLGSLKKTVDAILSATNVEGLVAALEELTKIPQEDMLDGISMLGQASSLDEWARTLEVNPAELMEAISCLLEEAGASKEELAEVMYSNDLWTLLSVANSHAVKLSSALEGMLNSENQSTQQQAANMLVLLKTVETVLPTKDLLGWQQAGLTQLSSQLKGIIESETVLKTNDNRNHIQSAFANSLLNVTKSGREQASNEGASEQNQSQLLQNASTQPIVSKTVFSLETAEGKPTSQSEALLAKLQGLFKQTNFGQQGGTNRLMIKLNPEQLGQIRIELIQMNGVMTARILASTALGKDLLDSQLHQLRQSFIQQNIQVDRIDVAQAASDPARNDRNQSFNHQQFKGNDEQQEPQEQQEQQSFQEFLLDVEV